MNAQVTMVSWSSVLSSGIGVAKKNFLFNLTEMKRDSKVTIPTYRSDGHASFDIQLTLRSCDESYANQNFSLQPKKSNN